MHILARISEFTIFVNSQKMKSGDRPFGGGFRIAPCTARKLEHRLKGGGICSLNLKERICLLPSSMASPTSPLFMLRMTHLVAQVWRNRSHLPVPKLLNWLGCKAMQQHLIGNEISPLVH
ncbi:MAG: hypothetical protein HC862_28380 [Scytonema sp. RU_4_4]|nr:hypothetical protein [Scytonema sp. RU_4_4]NJR72664.1 hypothetical protein [Scytonema sp. CRU_2_7]